MEMPIKTTENWITKLEGRFALGSLKQDSLDFRKADDLIQLGATFQYKNDTNLAKWNPTAALTLRTQFADGFDYGTSPRNQGVILFCPGSVNSKLSVSRINHSPGFHG